MLLLHHHRHEEKKTNATRLRDARTKRREKNFLRPQDRRAQNSPGFIIRGRSDDAFGTTSEKKITIYILLHHRSTSRSRRRTHSARARAFFSFFSYLRYKNEKRDRRAQKDLYLLSSAIVPTTSSERPQIRILSPSSLDVEKPKKNP